MLKINSYITLLEPKKNKNYGYYTIIEKKDPGKIKIKSKSASGRQRGMVGYVEKDGYVHLQKGTDLRITSDIQKKIDLVLDLVYGLNRIKHNFIVQKNLICIN